MWQLLRGVTPHMVIQQFLLLGSGVWLLRGGHHGAQDTRRSAGDVSVWA